ncbi:tRNA methyltransferase 10 homolog C [Triplophysa rosa]|uniref:tRNA methyltransferase 10 homolog C n=1 Tax=Triplophysa rosa TaxID=992332 RepID=A0A9W7X0G7_TRIRA|nr:tRNA methyltransferase 10 homolog C [Triplophysa rosa]XP_057187696.1 tRNA methyltransferase 10 homolog C [Triplophysa rosa]KAI7811550.1 putative mitochondrial ribonuclease P protein 1-like [Triplophysa rosa]
MMLQRFCSRAARWRYTSAPFQTVFRKHVVCFRFLVAGSVSSAHVLTRPISTSWSFRKDEADSVPAEKLDLDIWKSMMKSQALHEERNGEENLTPRAEAEPSLMDANRELVEMWHHAGKMVPKNITDEQLEHLSGLTTKSAKKKFLKFLAIKERHKVAKKEKKEEKKLEKKAEVDDECEKDVGDALKNTFLLRFWSRSMDTLLNWRGAQTMRFGQPLVYDMSYDQHMTRREIENTVSQLMETEGWNRRSGDPFHLHFCNLQPNGTYYKELLKRYGTETWERLFITATARQHVEMFPHESIVYLTADSPNVLHRFDHSKVYVVGAMVDRSIHTGVSLANAKRLRLATARLPLDEYLDWDSGAKNLTLDQMIRILTTIKETGSWQKALEFVPKRKHSGFCQHRSAQPRYRTLVNGDENRERERDRIFVSKRRRPSSDYSCKESVRVSSDASKGQTVMRNKTDGQKINKERRNWWVDNE